MDFVDDGGNWRESKYEIKLIIHTEIVELEMLHVARVLLLLPNRFLYIEFD